MFLTDSDLQALTGKVRYSAQARVLDALRVPYRRRPDGSLVVLRVHVESAQNAAPEPRLRLA